MTTLDQTTLELQQSIWNLCEKMAQGYYNYRMYDDLLQEGLLACYEVMHKYIPDNYDKPEQYFWFVARRGMSDFYKRRSKLVVPPKGYREPTGGTPSERDIRGYAGAYVNPDDCYGADELSVGDTQRTNYEYKDYKQWLTQELFASMTPREKQIISYRYYSDPLHVMTYDKVGLLLDPPLTASRVRHIETDVLGRFK